MDTKESREEFDNRKVEEAHRCGTPEGLTGDQFERWCFEPVRTNINFGPKDTMQVEKIHDKDKAIRQALEANVYGAGNDEIFYKHKPLWLAQVYKEMSKELGLEYADAELSRGMLVPVYTVGTSLDADYGVDAAFIWREEDRAKELLEQSGHNALLTEWDPEKDAIITVDFTLKPVQMKADKMKADVAINVEGMAVAQRIKDFGKSKKLEIVDIEENDQHLRHEKTGYTLAQVALAKSKPSHLPDILMHSGSDDRSRRLAKRRARMRGNMENVIRG